MIKRWLKEKTTWLGFFAVAGAFGLPELSEAQQAALSALAVSFFVMNDRG